MDIINVTLIAIVAMASVVAVTLPLIFYFKGWQAWRAIPADVYTKERMTLFHLRPLVLWTVGGIVSYLGRVCQWLHWQTSFEILDGLSLGILGLLLVAHLIWAVRLLRRSEGVNNQLRLFARYTTVGASLGLLVLVAGVLAKCVTV